jgi:hypothetical protein
MFYAALQQDFHFTFDSFRASAAHIMSPDPLRTVTVQFYLSESPESGKAKRGTVCNPVHSLNAVPTEGRGIMELGTHGGNGTEIVPEVTGEVIDLSEWPERAAQGKGKKSKLTSSQAKVSQLLETLGEIDAKRVKLDSERDELKKQLATAVANL